MKKYRTGGWGNKLIDAIEIDRETESSIWIKGRRSAKNSDYHQYFDTWAAAQDFLLQKAERSVENCRRQLEVATGTLGNIKGLREDC